MKISQVYPSKYLKAGDLKGPTRDRITAITTEAFGDNKERKFVFTFAGQTKPLVCNITNSRAMVEMTGSDESDDWLGTEVLLTPAKVTMNGRKVDTIILSRPPVLRKSPGGQSAGIDDLSDVGI